MAKVIRITQSRITGEVTSHKGTRKAITSNGCNEPCGKRFLCPKRKWPMKEMCPFINKEECDDWVRWCGSL